MAPSRVSERIISRKRMATNVGMRMLQAFSMPPCTPLITMAMLVPMNNAWYKNISPVFPIKLPKNNDNAIAANPTAIDVRPPAIILAKAGREVHVHDVREDSGSRFDGDFQGLENWTSDTDFLDELRDWGIDSSEFKVTPFHEVDVIHPDDVVTRAWSPTIAFRVVERGTASHTIDQGLKRQAIAAGAHIHYKSRVKPEDCHIVAAGPRDTSAVAFGEIFETPYPNHVAFHFNDKLAPGAYAYLIVIDGIGLICTCLWRKQQKSGRFLNPSHFE